MKVFVYAVKNGNKLHFYNERMKGLESDKMHDYLGELDLPIIAPKKTVKKEKNIHLLDCGFTKDGMFIPVQWVPTNAKNIKLNYEVEE